MATEWSTPDGQDLLLLTPEEFERVPDGMELVSISGERVVKGRDAIDDDLRFGFMAYGLPAPTRKDEKE